MNDDLAGGLVVLVLVAFVAQIALQILAWVLQLALFVALVFAVIACFLLIGIAASLTIGTLIAGIGDWVGAYDWPALGRLGLFAFWLAPWPLWGVVAVLGLVGLWTPAVWGAPVALYMLIFSVPAYYATWWSNEISGGRRKIALPFKTEATMHAEERLLLGQSLAWLAKLWYGL